jgi:hypothetical protein
MVADSQMVAGLYAPYDPPLAHANFTRQSTGSTSRWSEQTRVDSAVEVEEKKDKAVRFSLELSCREVVADFGVSCRALTCLKIARHHL